MEHIPQNGWTWPFKQRNWWLSRGFGGPLVALVACESNDEGIFPAPTATLHLAQSLEMTKRPRFRGGLWWPRWSCDTFFGWKDMMLWLDGFPTLLKETTDECRLFRLFQSRIWGSCWQMACNLCFDIAVTRAGSWWRERLACYACQRLACDHCHRGPGLPQHGPKVLCGLMFNIVWPF